MMATCQGPYRLNEGTIIFNLEANKCISIAIQSAKPDEYKDCRDSRIVLEIGENQAKFYGFAGVDQNKVDFEPFVHKPGNFGYEPEKKVSYWLSFNRDDRELKYGKGYIMKDTTILTLKLEPTEKPPDKWSALFDIAKPNYCLYPYWANSTHFPPAPGVSSLEDTKGTVNFYPYPLINDWPHLVKDSATATIFDIASNKYILSACLPATCQDLYAMVASSSVNLDSELAEAIGCSLKSGKLKEKLEDPDESGGMSSYLRVTLGVDHGSSPGIPFILELWPIGSESLIHNHGNAYGIVKVVHGEIDVHIYNKTWPKEDNAKEGEPEEIGKPMTLYKGDVTWLSPNWYQTHKLSNLSGKDYCATIQCYKYGDDDNIKYPYFDYWDKSKTKEFTPKSDLDFIEMVKLALEDYKKEGKP